MKYLKRFNESVDESNIDEQVSSEDDRDIDEEEQ